jgi:hypothetical protein
LDDWSKQLEGWCLQWDAPHERLAGWHAGLDDWHEQLACWWSNWHPVGWSCSPVGWNIFGGVGLLALHLGLLPSSFLLGRKTVIQGLHKNFESFILLEFFFTFFIFSWIILSCMANAAGASMTC